MIMRKLLFLLPVALLATQGVQGAVRFERVPDGGIQPQVIREKGKLHLLYFKGDAMGGDVFYATRADGQTDFSKPIKVNQRAGSVIVAGTMRGPQMALGADGIVHVVWMGGNGAEKVSVGGTSVTPLLYARLAETKDRFERERNILTQVAGLDGGQTVAADTKGNVFVIWHGAPPGTESEEERGLYVARSANGGKTFAREEKASVPKRGACACCGIRAQVDASGALHVLFRAAEAGVNRSELWLKSADQGKSFEIVREDPWKTASCPASSASFDVRSAAQVGAWETDGRVLGAVRKGGKVAELRPGGETKQKHPSAAANAGGEVLLTWVEDAGWGTEGTLVAQEFGSDGRTKGERVRKTKLPAWSFGAVTADENGDFLVIY
jgi:hypothetical protein